MIPRIFTLWAPQFALYKTDIVVMFLGIDHEQEIADRQAGTIAELLDTIPSVTLINGSTPQGSGINIRGFGANNTYGTDQKVAIQIDGASVGSEELYRIGTQLFTDPLLYREATVLRGTIGSFAYGSGIVGGVVKLDTKNASDFTGGEHGLAVGQTAEYSSNGEGVSSSTTLAWQPNDQAEFLLNFSYRSYDDYLDGDGDVVGNTAFTTPSGLAKARFTFGEMGDQSLTFVVSRTVADDKDVPYDQFATTGGSFGNVDRLTDTTQASVEYGYNPLGNDLVDFTANLSYADQKIEYDYVPGSSPLEGTPSFPFLVGTVNADQRYETTKLKLANTARFGTGGIGHSLETGVEVQERCQHLDPVADVADVEQPRIVGDEAGDHHTGRVLGRRPRRPGPSSCQHRRCWHHLRQSFRWTSRPSRLARFRGRRFR